MKKLLIIIITICVNFPCLLSQAYPSWENYSFSQRVTGIDFNGNDIWISTQGGLVKYNKKTGDKTYYNRANANLPDNNLLNVFCNTNGDVWVGGKYYGIGKFNINKCTIYNQSNSGLPFDQYNSKIKVDKNGNVWIASFRWMAKFNGNSWKTWITGNDLDAFPIISDFVIDDKDVVWMCSTDGFGKIENDEYIIIPGIYGSRNQCMGIDNNKKIWIGIDGRGLYQYNGSTFTNYNTENSCLPSNFIKAISFDAENNMWLASGGLVRFSPTSCKIYNPPQSSQGLLTLKCDNNDTIWCGSFSGKLLCFDGNEFTSIDLSNSPLKDNYILDILIDDDNNKWIGTKRNAVKKTDSQFYSVFNNRVNALIQDKERVIWTLFDSGDTCLLKMKTNGNTVFDSLNSPLNNNKINTSRLAVDNNNLLWLTTSRSGLYKYDGISFTNYNTTNSAIPSNQVFQLVFDKENTLWGGSANGLFKFDGITWTVWNRTNSNIPTNVVVGLAFDYGNKLWFSCMDENRIIGIDYGGGLTCFDGQTMKTYKTNNSGLLTNTIWDVYIDAKGLVWLGTCGGGLMSFDKKDKWSSYNVTNSGIANNIVQWIRQDKSGNLWLGHIDAGISVFNPDSFNLSVNNKDERYLSLVLFPNPVNDDLYVNFKTNGEWNVQASVYDLNGKLIHVFSGQKTENGNQTLHYNLSGILISSQLYIIYLKFNNNQYYAKFLYLGE